MKRLAGVLLLLLVAAAARGQTFEVFHAFSGEKGDPQAALITGSDGRFYGTTTTGGFFGKGSVYSLLPDGAAGYAYEEVHSFSGLDGATPLAPLIQAADGAFYGTTSEGGAFGLGTVFVVNAGHAVTTLHDFSGADGANPAGGFIQAADGSLYGTTVNGGDLNLGTVFRIAVGGTFVRLHSFGAFGGDGANPNSGLIAGGDGNLYGTTLTGGASNQGSVYRITPAGVEAVVDSFDGANGAYPQAALVRADNGYFYGVTAFGGSHDRGSLFRVGYLGGLTAVYDFNFLGEPRTTLIQAADGKLYGTTIGVGIVFAIQPGGSNFAILHQFGDGVSSAFPWASLLEVAPGEFIGALAGNFGLHGEVYSMDAFGNVEDRHDFGTTEGANPYAGLIQASDGNLYGVTAGPGSGYGTMFRLGLDGTLTTLHIFDGNDAAGPTVALLEGSDGLFYGVSSSGGYGNVFRSDWSGTTTSLHAFNSADGASPGGSLVEGSGGLFYGVTSFGGDASGGTLFRIDASGTLETLCSLAFPSGSEPRGRLALVGGSLLGTTHQGGANGVGTLFRWDGVGGFSDLWDFGGDSGFYPASGLLEVSGHFYGTTSSTIFDFQTPSTMTTIHTLDPGEGAYPSAELIGTGGELYGTAQGGGSSGKGTLFRIAADGTFTKLHDFAGPEGEAPQASLLLASDGNLYGTAPLGGPGAAGVVFRLAPASSPDVLAVSPTSGRAAGGTSVDIVGTHFQPGASPRFGSASALVLDVNAQHLRALSAAVAPGTLYDLTVTNVDASSATLPAAWFADFLDMDSNNPFHDFVESIVRAGITAGCGGGNYCGTASVTRAQVAVFLLKAEHGSSFVPPSCAGLFPDVPCPGGFAVDWIEQLFNEGITGGCGGGNYCPNNGVRRDQMAVFLLKASQGPAYVPPPASGTIFADVPATAFAADWIEDLYARSITGGCLTNPLRYCPTNTSNRQQMAVYITKAFGLQ